jgi:cobalt/nickel transport system permease protein
MVCETFHETDSPVHRLDPRGRVLAAMAFSVLMAVSQDLSALGAGLAMALALACLARLPPIPVVKRLAALNAFTAFLWVVLPLTAPGRTISQVGPFEIHRAGVMLAARITLKANAIVLAITALISTLEISVLGHAMDHLHVPDKLTHLFLFTVRYLDVMHHEYHRLRQAMKVRCFRPRMDLHTCRTFGHLVGMLLVKSLGRSERVLAAMKCRGFTGRFYVLHHFTFAGRDAVFGVLSLAALLALGWMTWA